MNYYRDAAHHGVLYEGLMKRVEALGTRGCRAILWRQGEADAGQTRAGFPVEQQITGKHYGEFMEKLIRAARKRAGWDVPWFIALATYHSEKGSADDEFRAAQKGLCTNGAFRLAADVLDKGAVNLLFVEFAVNDAQNPG